VVKNQEFAIDLVRHGETSSYRSDSGLTARGRDQAFSTGRALAAEFDSDTVVLLRHAYTARATETAALIREGLHANGIRQADRLHAERLFDNFRVWCGSTVLDPTAASAQWERLRAAGRRAGWCADLERYLAVQDSGGDPVGYWMTTPLQYFEPATMVVHRFWQGMLAAARSGVTEGRTRMVVSTHSGCLRAVFAAASGADPGEPENVERVRIVVWLNENRTMVSFRTVSAEVELPDPDALPWVQPC
jgi:broad specificity phosphatase PhoE